jgi:iron complex outermembrane receptor protein
MKTIRLAALATTALAGLTGVAHAQSTGTSAVETVVITGQSGPPNAAGMIQAETVAKTRTTVTNEFIETQTPGQTILATLNVVTPGLNFTNTDPYGSSGGNIRLHGFDGNRVALTFDGMPLNDSGNYAVFTNQMLDGELIGSAQVNTGSTDVDSPTAAGSGGTIGFVSRTPSKTAGIWGQYGIGDFAYNRYMVFGETGEVGPFGTRAWVAYSDTGYDKFKGQGALKKKQFNAKIYQPLGDGNDFVSVAFHYNENRNNAYNGPNLAVNANPTTGLGAQFSDVDVLPSGWKTDLLSIYQPIVTTTRAGFAGDIDRGPAAGTNVSTGLSNSGYWSLRINPSNTGNIRMQSRFDFGDHLTLTVDPSFQYVLANGGTQNTVVWESCNGATSSATLTSCPVQTRQLLGNIAPSLTAGVDLNHDGDINDFVRVMNPSTTNTRRVGLISSLIWRLNDDQLIRGSYAYDRARHRQTGEFGYINDDLTYQNPFGGKDGQGQKIYTADGQSFLRNRDRFSIAQLNQFSLEYRGKFFDALNVSVGLRAPYFERELNQNCYTQNGTNIVRCTSEVPTAAPLTTTSHQGNVLLPNAAAGATLEYIPAFKKTVKYDDLLPNVGVSYKFFSDFQAYGSYTESTSLPRTDNLYTVLRLADGSIATPGVQPETSKQIEGGLRYDANHLIGSISAWHTDFQNRIVTSFDQDLGINVDRNVGKVSQSGVDASLGWQPADELTLYLSASYNESEVKDNILSSITTSNGVVTQNFIPTKGKTIVETPDWTWSARAEYEIIPDLTFGFQVKIVGDRWVTDVNDLKADGYTTADADLSWKLNAFGLDKSSIRVNVINIFDEEYYGNLGTTSSATSGALGFSRPFASIGAPRTATVTFRAGF